MYRPAAFAVDDLAVLHDVVRQRSFATLAVAAAGNVHLAYAPLALDAGNGRFGTVRFHLARGNSFAAAADGAVVLFSLLGPDAYVSPDWYETAGRVPTWNYIAVEGQGLARKLDAGALRALLVDLSAEQEARLLPKAPWTIEKVPAERMAALLGGIEGFEVRLESLTGKFKLSQNVGQPDLDGVAAGLEARGDAASRAVAAAMRAARRVA